MRNLCNVFYNSCNSINLIFCIRLLNVNTIWITISILNSYFEAGDFLCGGRLKPLWSAPCRNNPVKAGEAQQNQPLRLVYKQTVLRSGSGITAQVSGCCCQRTQSAGTRRRWRCCWLCASGIKGRHCWNEKQMLVRNSPDCSSFFFFHARASSAASFLLSLSLSLSLLYPLSSFSPWALTHAIPTWSYS